MYKIDLQTFIKRNKLTQKKLGEILGVGQPFISQILNGKSSLSSDKIEFLLNDGRWDTSMITMIDDSNVKLSDTITMSREVFELILSQQRTIESQQRIIESNKGGVVQVEENAGNADVG